MSCNARLQQHVAALKFLNLSKKTVFGLCWLMLPVKIGTVLRPVWQTGPHEL